MEKLLAELIGDALKECRRNKHLMGSFYLVKNDDPNHYKSECSQCKMTVEVIQGAPEGKDIIGKALTQDCGTKTEEEDNEVETEGDNS